MYHIAPSLLCANQAALGEDIRQLNGLGVDWMHIDVMDGSFVPNFAFGADAVRAVKAVSERPLYVHMMCVRPERHVEAFAKLGADYYCFHFETTDNPFRLCAQIREAGMRPAVALNPITPVSALGELLNYVEAVTIMSIEPGFSGQSFLPFSYRRMSELRTLIGERKVIIEVDGGVDNAIAKRCFESGCDIVVGGYFTLFDKKKGGIAANYQSFAQEALEGKA